MGEPAPGEIISVFAVSLGSNMLHAIVPLIGSITGKRAPSEAPALPRPPHPKRPRA